MAITLGSNIASLRGQRQLSRTGQELGTVFQRLSSGQRINRASDDAAGLAIADSLNARSRVYNQGVRNLNDGLSLLSIADSAIANLSDIVIRLEELVAQLITAEFQEAIGRTASVRECNALKELQKFVNDFFKLLYAYVVVMNKELQSLADSGDGGERDFVHWSDSRMWISLISSSVTWSTLWS
jgi:hypothetical protein